MPTDTDLELTKTACFRGDVARIKRFAEILEAREKAGFSSQHVVTRALDALEKLISQPTQDSAAT
jgi:hypothetical protein